MGDMQFNGTPDEWDALVKKNRETTMAQAISKMETTQTAVEWLIQELELEGYPFIIKLAKAMEKEQIIDAFDSGLAYDYDEAETYYNKTYNNGL